MAKLEPKDGNIEKYEADIRKNILSFQAYLKDHAHGSTYSLIQYFAESMAYQYSVNRFHQEQEIEYVKKLRKIHKEDSELLKAIDDLVKYCNVLPNSQCPEGLNPYGNLLKIIEKFKTP